MASWTFARLLETLAVMVIAFVAIYPTDVLTQTIAASGNSINVALPVGGQFSVQTGSNAPVDIATSVSISSKFIKMYAECLVAEAIFT